LRQGRASWQAFRVLVVAAVIALGVAGITDAGGGAAVGAGGSRAAGSYIVVLKPSADRSVLVGQARSAGGTIALCIASGPCAGLTPAQIIQKIVGDAAAYNAKNTGYGFQGDPLRPIGGRYYGYLISAGIY
jgi:hypothetical protein